MIRHSKIFLTLFLAVLFSLTALPVLAALTPTSELPPPKFTDTSQQTLVTNGCEAVQIRAGQSYVFIPDDKPHYIIPANRVDSTLVFCSSSTLRQIEVFTQQNLSTDIPAADAGPIDWATEKMAGLLTSLTKNVTNVVLGMIAPILVLIIDLWGGIARFFINQALVLLGPILGAGNFITHPMVTLGWPFVQGLANIGFILALIFIALATVLQLEFNARRMLPRLLIAAILINFSLVIGGVIIDSSRILMAIMMNLMVPAGASLDINDIGATVLEASSMVGLIETLSTQTDMPYLPFGGGFIGTGNIQRLIAVFIKTAILWLFAGALFVMVAQLFIRYVVLIILLIVSPLAYLAFAVPGADRFARQWWQSFLKYVFYGPIVTFMLLLLTRVTQLNDKFPTGGDPFFYGMLNLAITAALLILAATAGKQAGLVGSGMILGTVDKYGRKISGGTLKGSSKLVYAGTKAALNRAAPGVGSAINKAEQNLKGVAVSYKEAGGRKARREEEAAKNTRGAALAERFTDREGYRRKQQEAANARAAFSRFVGGRDIKGNLDFTPARLEQSHVIDQFSGAELDTLLKEKNYDSQTKQPIDPKDIRVSAAQQEAILKNPDNVGKISTTVVQDILARPTNLPANLPEDAATAGSINAANDNRKMNAINKGINEANKKLKDAFNEGWKKKFEKESKGK